MSSAHTTGNVSRTDDFRPDHSVKTRSAGLADFKGSGYDRGHLAPAADFKWSAVEDAKIKANILAQAAGKELGEIVNIHHSWSEIMFSSNYHSLDAMSVSEAAPMMDIEPDDVRSSDSVEIVWNLV